MRFPSFVCAALLTFLSSFAANSAQAADFPLKRESLTWTGDMRYRFVNLKESIDDPRLYQQLRVRLGLKAEVQDDLTAVVRLATATSAISNNQTLGDAKEPGMPRRSFGVDLAYGEWRFLDGGRVWLGRTPNPFFAPGKTQLIFDSDLAFEGFAAAWQPKWSGAAPFVNFGAYIISENYNGSEDAVDTGIVGLDIGGIFKTDFGQFTLHAARYHFLNIIDRPVVSIEKDVKVDAYSYPFDRIRGNSAYPNDPLAAPADRKYYYKYDFVQSNLGAEWKLKATNALEFTVYGDWVNNERAGTLGSAFETGATVRYGRATLLAATAMKKSDSVVGAFTDSDMNGGGTDTQGTKLSVAYQLSDFSNIVFTNYNATRGTDSVPRDFRAQQLDLSIFF